MRIVVGVLSFAIATNAWAQAPGDCVPASAGPAEATAVLPLAPELPAPAHRLGAPSGVLEHAMEEALSVDRVLTRMRLEACMLAKATPAATPGIPAATDPAAYQPKTEFDNTPWRFDMNQNGKRMTADEFSAWMEARGVRVARGAAPAAAPAQPPPAEPPPAEPPGD